jgi:hypothetical protein
MAAPTERAVAMGAGAREAAALEEAGTVTAALLGEGATEAARGAAAG